MKAVGTKAKVLVNPETPGKGNFIIRVNGGEPIVELLEMKRPFPALKALDMEDVIAKVVEAVDKAGVAE